MRKEFEFRFICTDCRAYLENPNDILSKPLKGGFDAYTNEWTFWAKTITKQKIFELYKINFL